MSQTQRSHPLLSLLLKMRIWIDEPFHLESAEQRSKDDCKQIIMKMMTPSLQQNSTRIHNRVSQIGALFLV